MFNQKLRILALLAACLLSLTLLWLLFSMVSAVNAGLALQEPTKDPLQQPLETIEPAVFPEEPGEEEGISAQGGLQPAGYIISPTINYQGYLSDAGGSPINATLSFTVALYDNIAGDSLVWGPENHPGVQVQKGLFNLVLGQNAPLNPADFSQALYLEIEVEDTLLPRQTLRTVPYAFSLVPGAFVRGNLDTELVRIENNGDNFALYVEENGATDYGLGADRIFSDQGYASGADSYLWVPGNLALTPYTEITLVPSNIGRVVINRSAAGSSSVFIPIALLTRLYGHDIVVEEVRVYYYTSNANTYINDTTVNKLTAADDFDVIASTGDNQTSTTATYYQVPIDASSPYTLTNTSGPLTVKLSVNFANPAHSIYLGGVRVRLGHPRSDGQ